MKKRVLVCLMFFLLLILIAGCIPEDASFEDEENNLVGEAYSVLGRVSTVRSSRYIKLIKPAPSLEKCTDTDEGINYNEKGKITVIYEDGHKRTEIDSCNPDGTLREWFCGKAGDPAGLLRSENYAKCPNGYVCEDGACVEEPVVKECYFAEEIKQPSICPEGNCKILIIAESEIFDLIEGSLVTFSSDLKNELGYDVDIRQLTRKSDETNVKAMIMEEYESGGLKGVFLIGNIPTARMPDHGYGIKLSDQQYYQDVFGKCQYSSDDDTYDCESITKPFLPPFWVSRIMAPIDHDSELFPDEWTEEQRLDYLKEFKKENYFLGQNKNDELLPNWNLIKTHIIITSDNERAQLTNQYFNYNHLYRTGQISTIKEPILYTPIENDNPVQAEISKQLIKENLIKAGYSQNEVHFLNSAPEENNEFLEAIEKPYEFGFINAHGTPVWHQYNIKKETLKESNTLILGLSSCSVGNFREPDFIAGHYLMNGKTQFLTAGSVNIFGALHINEGYLASLTNGKRLFEAWEFDPTQLNWFGDPTIKMRYEAEPLKKEGPRICISSDKLDSNGLNFGDITQNLEKISFKIYNKGSGTLEISHTHDLYPRWLFFNEKMPEWESGSMFARGGISKVYSLTNDGSYLEWSIGINNPDIAVSDDYNGFVYLVSNDVNYPVLKIPLSFSIG